MTQDVSQGYGLHCFNMQEMTWDFAMCEELGFSKDLLPEIYPCHAVIGTVTEEAAKESGLCVGIPVVAGGLDAACWESVYFTMERHRSKAGRQGG
jgi:xylulokinase